MLVKRPGLPLRAEVVENTLRSRQELVDGPIECVTVTEDLAIVCNEEGRLRGLPENVDVSITRKAERLVRQIVREAEI